MKLKIIGFKVEESRPTANRSFSVGEKMPSGPNGRSFLPVDEKEFERLGCVVEEIISKSDFISIRRVNK
jgi:hypothetical protein